MKRNSVRCFVCGVVAALLGWAVISVAREPRADERLAHWAYQPLAEVASPGGAGVHPVDAFVLEKLGDAGLAMSPEADRRTLIRRLTYNLHGLPPTPEEVGRFVDDPDPDAYEKLVDRLLESERYGERYARHWLDIAHYADTHGFERDRRRDSAWRYRDYVIRSFNEDKRYDRFLREQIAGDALWPGDEDAVVATGFLAAGPWDYVGQEETKSPVLRRASRALDLDDMVTQVMAATVAMTVNCARCHDHKLDPITREEYYGLWAVFAGVKRGERAVDEPAKEREAAERGRLTAALGEAVGEIREIEGRGIDLADIVGGGDGTGTGKVRRGIDLRSGAAEERELGRVAGVEANRFVAVAGSEWIDGVFVPDGGDGKAKVVVDSGGAAVEGLPRTSGEVWDVIRNGPVASQHSVELGGIDFTRGGHTLLGLHANAGITFDLGAIRRTHGLGGMRFRAQVGYFGMEGDLSADAWVYIDGAKVAEFRGMKRGDGLRGIDVAVADGARSLTLVATDGGNGISHDQVGFGDPLLEPDGARGLAEAELGRLEELKRTRADLETQIRGLGAGREEPRKFYGVVPEASIPEVRVLRRGDPESPLGDPVEPGALAALAMLDAELGGHGTGQGERRAALAEWITARDNPLTGRVIANRLWHWHFGQGIVETPSDFGIGGGKPSHPELLDWLAGELGRRGWSLKAMHRIILTSAAYKQRSGFGKGVMGERADAGNRLLWRQNPRRLEAEAVRDAVLLVSGKLNLERGGPGYEDFIYEEAYAPIYTYVTADKAEHWRRSIYRYLVRTTPDRFMATLDCPDPANLTPKRQTTTTALQSLALYNNDFMLRQARYMGERVRVEGGETVEGQVVRAFGLAFGREPIEEELKMGVEFIGKEGVFAFCRSLLNANEFVYLD